MRRLRGRYVNVVLDVDIEPFLRAVRKASQDAARALDTMAQSVRRMGKAMAHAHEVQVSGMEQRMYVRAGLDPDYATPEALDRLVRLLLRKPSAVLGLGASLFLTTTDRVRLATAAMRGWAEHRSAPEPEHPALPWHRYMGKRVYLHADGRLEVYS